MKIRYPGCGAAVARRGRGVTHFLVRATDVVCGQNERKEPGRCGGQDHQAGFPGPARSLRTGPRSRRSTWRTSARHSASSPGGLPTPTQRRTSPPRCSPPPWMPRLLTGANAAAGAWLTGIARHVVAAEYRRAARDRAAVRRVSGRRLLDADDISRLEERIGQRAVLELVVIDGLSLAESATALGIPPVTARVRLHRARRALRRLPPAPPAPRAGRADPRAGRATAPLDCLPRCPAVHPRAVPRCGAAARSWSASARPPRPAPWQRRWRRAWPARPEARTARSPSPQPPGQSRLSRTAAWPSRSATPAIRPACKPRLHAAGVPAVVRIASLSCQSFGGGTPETYRAVTQTYSQYRMGWLGVVHPDAIQPGHTLTILIDHSSVGLIVDMGVVATSHPPVPPGAEDVRARDRATGPGRDRVLGRALLGALVEAGTAIATPSLIRQLDADAAGSRVFPAVTNRERGTCARHLRRTAHSQPRKPRGQSARTPINQALTQTSALQRQLGDIAAFAEEDDRVGAVRSAAS